MTPTVRFSSTSVANDRHGVHKMDSRRQSKIALDSGRENIDDSKFTLSRTWVLSTVILLFAIVVLSYRGYLDTRAVNYPYQGAKVRK